MKKLMLLATVSLLLGSTTTVFAKDVGVSLCEGDCYATEQTCAKANGGMPTKACVDAYGVCMNICQQPLF